MIRERLLNQKRPWLLKITLTCFLMTILIMIVPATIFIEKSQNSENMDKLNKTALFGQIGDIDKSFVAPPTEDKPPKDLRIYTEAETQNMMRTEKIKNVAVVSKSGAVFNGFEGPMMTYNETETLCSSKGARLPWFEMMAGQFSGPVWIESSANFITRNINASDEIGHETLKRVMKTFLDENSPFELNYSEFPIWDGVFSRDPSFCLSTMPTFWSTINSIDKRFVCKNETFDEQGRLILFCSKIIFCELEKSTSELVEKYQPSVQALQDVTWVTRYLSPSGWGRMQSGWTIFDDYEESGIPLCSASPDFQGPEVHLVQQEELRLSRARNAHALCIYPE